MSPRGDSLKRIRQLLRVVAALKKVQSTNRSSSVVLASSKCESRTNMAADISERMEAMGMEAEGTDPVRFGAQVREEIAKWAQVVKTAGVKLD